MSSLLIRRKKRTRSNAGQKIGLPGRPCSAARGSAAKRLSLTTFTVVAPFRDSFLSSPDIVIVWCAARKTHLYSGDQRRERNTDCIKQSGSQVNLDSNAKLREEKQKYRSPLEKVSFLEKRKCRNIYYVLRRRISKKGLCLDRCRSAHWQYM